VPRQVWIVGPAVLLAVGFAALLGALAFGGGAVAPVLLDPGPVVLCGLPIARLVLDLSLAATIGPLLFAVWTAAPKQREYDRALDIAAGASALLAVAAIVTGLLTFLSITGTPLSFDDKFTAALGQYVADPSLGGLWLWVVVLAALTTVLCFAVRDQRAVLFVLVAAVAVLLPLAQMGHAAAAAAHDEAVNALGLHLLGASVWIGGVIALVLLSRSLAGPRLLAAVERFSSFALACFIVVAISGYVSAQLRIGSLDALLSTPYGLLVLVKVAALLALGLLGAWQRTRIITAMRRAVSVGASTARPFWLLIVIEIACMGVAAGVAVALARTATPVPVDGAVQAVTPAEILTGEPLPPELTALSYLTTWRIDLVWLLVCAFGIFFYWAGVLRLRRRGDRWPWYRGLLWTAGMLALFYVTNGALNEYERYLFSVHMLGHMALTMAVPLLLVAGAPVTLASRAIRKRDDGSRGGREWILWAVHTPFARVITHPLVAAVVFVGSLWAFYYTPLLRWAAVDHIGHEWMIVHFLISGYLFVQSLIGIDPVPYRFPYPLRIVTLFATMALHAFFGLALVEGTGLLLADWFGAMGRTWGPDPLADQRIGGAIAWGIGEIPTFVLAVVVAVQWARSDERESRRRDRASERSGELDLVQYNRMLQRLSARDSGGSEGG